MTSIKDTWLSWYKDRRVEDGVVNFAELLRKAKSRKVLDLGTGTGRHTVYLASLGFDMYGFDWSENAIAITKEELLKNRLSASLKVWDMNRIPLPYGDEFFDAILAVRVLHHTYMHTIEQIVSEIVRMTRVGGYLYLEVPTYEEVIKQKLEGVKSDEREPGTFIPLAGEEVGVPHHHFKLNELLTVFAQFKLLTLEDKGGHYCFTGVRM